MKVVAAHAGVTQATVSMCLANNPRISAATRERVQAIALKLGYEPNPYISTLMRIRRQGRPLKERPVLALVCAQRSADGWRNHASVTIRQMREGALARAAERGYRAQEFWLHCDGMSNERFSQILHARGIHGLLISPLADGDAPPALRWEHFTTVSLTVPMPSLNVTTVCSDHYFSSLQAVRECHRRGYCRPGLVLKRSHHLRFEGRWQAGYLVSPQMLPGLRVCDPLYLENWDQETPALLQWLEREQPDVILSPGCDVLQSVLAREGWGVPKDIGLAWLACTRLGHPCSGIFQNGPLIGATAVDTLISMIERHERGLPRHATTLMVEGQWNAGQTLRPASAL